MVSLQLVSLTQCFVLLLILDNLCGIHSFKTSLYMTTSPPLDDYSPLHSTWTLTTDSAYMCIYTCSLNPDCVSAFYHPVEKACLMTDTKYRDTSQLQPHPGMKYYGGTLPTTCSDIGFAQTASSGENLVYPDDWAGQFGPVRVWCDLDSEPGTAITVLHHDHEARTFVDGYEECGSYAVNLTYDVGLEVAKKIVDISTDCKQHIKWECFDVKMFYGDISNPCIRWKTRQMEDSGYLTGSEAGFDYCDCKQTTSCSYLGGCNCSKNDAQWRYDEGYVTNKQDLPITGFTAGDTGTHNAPGYVDEKGYHTIGPVLCH